MKLCCVHGWLGEAADFDAFCAAGAFEDALRYEVPGCGARVHERPGDLEWIARDLLARTAPGRVCVAYSMGARVALCAARLAPEHFASLVLCGVHPGLEDAAAREARRGVDRERARALREDPAGFLEEWFSMPLFAGLRDAAGFAALRARRREAFAGAAHVEGAARTLLACSLAEQAPLDRASAARLPRTIVVYGALDTKFAALARDMAALAPERIELRALPGVSHAVLTEAPEELARLVRDSARSRDAAGEARSP